MSEPRHEPTKAELDELARRSDRLRARAAARAPKRIGDIMAQIQARRGFAQIQVAGEIAEAWREVAGGMLASRSRVGPLRRGVLEIIVESSAILQEMTFQKNDLAARIASRWPDLAIRQLRFRIGPLK